MEISSLLLQKRKTTAAVRALRKFAVNKLARV
jgi:hypothetical protein